MNRIAFLEDRLQALGYTGEHGKVLREVEYLSSDAGRRKADLIAFGDSRTLDLSTACIVVEVCESESEVDRLLADLRYTGAPVAIIALPDRVRVSSVTSHLQGARPSQWVTYEGLQEFFGTNKGQLGPRSLSAAKRGDWQLSFLDIDPSLLHFAEEATRRSMVEHFNRTVGAVRESVRVKYPRELTRLAIYVLAARILQDKLGWKGGDYRDLERARDAKSLLDAAASHFPDYFVDVADHLEVIGRTELDTLYGGLSGRITFANLTNDTLGHFYEDALIDSGLRKEFGVYYTPRAIADRILRRLPIEDLPLDARHVLDGTCGSGNLLLAAHNRLSKLLPKRWSAEQRHQYLKTHIWGIDRDPTACDIARISLLLFSLPAGNDWRIREDDVFNADPKKMFGQRPTVIVGNPPFKESRLGREQKAANILRRYIDWLQPGGLLGTVVPISLLQNESGRVARGQLLSQFDIMEVWHLPEGAIPSSAVGTAVLIGRKHEEKSVHLTGGLTRVEEAVKGRQSAGVRAAADPLRYEVSYVVSQERWLTNERQSMESSSLDWIWDRIAKYPMINSNGCKLYNGVQVVGEQARKSHFSDADRGDGWRKVLTNNRSGVVLQPYCIQWAAQQQRYIRYPSPEIHRARVEQHFDMRAKVVFNATRNGTSPWRIYAALDTERLVVTENFHYAIPEPGVSAATVAAVLNSSLANAWFSGHNYHRDITLAHLRRLPFPNFTFEQKHRVKTLVRRITAARKSVTGVLQAPQLIRELDDVIFDVYECNSSEREAVRTLMDSFRRPGEKAPTAPGVKREPEDRQTETWRAVGLVEQVDVKRREIRIWLQDRDHRSTLRISGTMPGWLLRPNTGFTATIPYAQRSEDRFERISWLNFEPLEYSYLTEEQLAVRLTGEGVKTP